MSYGNLRNDLPGLWGTGRGSRAPGSLSVPLSGVCPAGEGAVLALLPRPPQQLSPLLALWPPPRSIHLPLPECTSHLLSESGMLLSALPWQTYGSLSAGEFQLIRQMLLIFFQDLHIRVSVQTAESTLPLLS